MYIVAQHEISDPEAFWQAAQDAPMPDHLKLHQVLPDEGGTRAVCLWEAPTVDQVREHVDGAVGTISTNRYFAVSAEKALGLPGVVQAQAAQM